MFFNIVPGVLLGLLTSLVLALTKVSRLVAKGKKISVGRRNFNYSGSIRGRIGSIDVTPTNELRTSIQLPVLLVFIFARGVEGKSTYGRTGGSGIVGYERENQETSERDPWLFSSCGLKTAQQIDYFLSASAVAFFIFFIF